MKEFSGNMWTESDKDGRVKIGFSKRFIEDRLGECFHVMQADVRTVKKGTPLFVIETNDGLESLKSPVSGTILVFNAKARNFPDRLTEEDVIAEVLPEGVKLEKAKKEKKEKVATTVVNEWIDFQHRPLEYTPEVQGLINRLNEARRRDR